MKHTTLVFLCLTLFFSTAIVAQNTNNDGFGDLNDTSITADSVSAGSDEEWFNEDGSATGTDETEIKQPKKQLSSVYPLIEISAATLLLYLLTWLLAKFNVIKKNTHRKIWNMVLLITFLVSGILGLVLVFQINYSILGNWYSDFLLLHVDFGIAMALISIFHILWHAKYFVNMFKKK